MARSLRSERLEGRYDVAQRSVEILIGRLITDEGFRMNFFADPATTLTRFIELGYDLTSSELAALKATRIGVWSLAAESIDPRLQKVALK